VAARWPADDGLAPAPITTGNTLPPIPGSNAAFAVEHQGELLGALSVTTPPNDPIDPAKTQLVSDLAAQAGLVLRNVRLGTALRARLADLQAAQKRLVTAQDEERRRLERNIHDGAQQQLVALTVKARLAGQFAERDPSKALELIAQIEDDTRRALEDLRDLARGIYPPLLADKGLLSALEAQARKSPVATTVQADGIGRFDQDVEAAVYFSCLEALQNVTKYAQAGQAIVRLANGDGHLTFEVRDDGVGFDPRAKGIGTGLQGMSDRLGALGGELHVTSAPGAGTMVRGSVPIETANRATVGVQP
jgi:signal transduction histidine kinase